MITIENKADLNEGIKSHNHIPTFLLNRSPSSFINLTSNFRKLSLKGKPVLKKPSSYQEVNHNVPSPEQSMGAKSRKTISPTRELLYYPV